MKYKIVHNAASILGVVIQGHEEALPRTFPFISGMPRGKEIQEWIQKVIEEVKTLHKGQHLTDTKQFGRSCEKHGHIHHAKSERKKANNQGSSDYSYEKFSHSRLFLVSHLSSLDSSNK